MPGSYKKNWTDDKKIVGFLLEGTKERKQQQQLYGVSALQFSNKGADTKKNGNH